MARRGRLLPLTHFRDTECSEGNQPTPEELEANLRIADGIHYSLEMGALKPDGTLDRPKEEAVRKIGHGELHRIHHYY